MHENRPLRYPASPQTNALEDAVKEGERLAHLVRLQKKSFQDNELAKCETLDQVLQLSSDIEEGKKIHESGLKLKESKVWENYEFYSDADTWPGIPITVELDPLKAAYLVSKQEKNSYKVVTSEFTYTKEEYEALAESLEDIEDQVQDVLTDTSGILHELKKDVDQQINLEKINLSNTGYLYGMAEKSTWKTMLDFQGYTLPGTADPHITCGTWRFTKCPEHNYGKRIIHSCNRLSCPICVRKAGQRIAKKIERRIWLFGLMVRKTSNFRRNPLPSHVIESIQADDIFWTYSKSKQQRILQEMRKIAGITAGVSITHYWRFEPGKLNPYVSIHNHLICYGWISPTAKKDIFQKLGVNVVYKKTANGTLRDRKNVFSVGFYLLSHCAIKNHKHSVHWFGKLSYRKVQNSFLKKFRDDDYILEDQDIEKSKSCKLCGLRMVPARIDKDMRNWQGFFPDPSDMDEGCVFPVGLLVEIDFFGERISFYGANYVTIFHKTKRELDEERYAVNPMIYRRTTKSHNLESWMS